MNGIKQGNLCDLPSSRKCEHEGYVYEKRAFLSRKDGARCTVAVYEIPPGKAAYPYHYHVQSEEVFYIVSGTGTLRTPEGERPVSAGELLYFPADASGAHKLTNASDSAPLIYLDYDTVSEIDVTFYPDSRKIGVWGKQMNQVYKVSEPVDYYEGE